MAAAAAAIDQAAVPKSVNQSLWWDSFVSLFTDLENAALSTDLSPSLAKKLKNNHGWFLGTLALFKPPNQISRSALNSPSFNVGAHQFVVEPELKDAAIQVSSCLIEKGKRILNTKSLDEVQSYILVQRYIECTNLVPNYKDPEFLHSVLVQYYLERQCLLKCTRQILMHTISRKSEKSKVDGIVEEALQLIRDGLEKSIFAVLQGLLSSKYPQHLDVELVNFWAEETLIEDNLVLDVLFLAYYEPFCSCTCEQWKALCSIFGEMLFGSVNIAKLAVSTEATNFFYYAKVQLLLILIETLDLDNLLRMVHDEVPFRQDLLVFSLVEVQEIDNIVSGFNAIEIPEAGPLILAWAVFLCLMSSLPEKQDYGELLEIDHVGYVCQAFKAAPLCYVLEILHSDVLRDADGPIGGYRSVLKTFISAFIASYDITDQLVDNTFSVILDILREIYRGQESLCMQFWDRDSFVDDPIRCLLNSLEGEFPFRAVEFVRLLSALCEGTWPAECVYKYLDKMVGLTSLFEIPGDSLAEDMSDTVKAQSALRVPGMEGIIIPSGTVGHVLKVMNGNVVLIRWEFIQSGVLLLLLRLAQEFHMNSYDEISAILDLLCQMVSVNMALGFALMDIDNSSPVQAARMNGHLEKNMQVDVVNIICTLVSKLIPNPSNAKVLSMCVTILAKLLKCSPSHVAASISSTNIFNVEIDSSSSGIRLLPGGLARIFSVDCDQNGGSRLLAISVLDFTIQLVETGAENDVVSILVVFALQYILVNHEHWKFNSKNIRWEVTLKVFELIHKCTRSTRCSQKLGGIVSSILLCDSSLHNVLLRVMCITTKTLEGLFVNRLYEPKEIEGLQLALCSALDIVFAVLADFSEDISTLPVFHQAMLCATTKPVPVVTATMSLICFFHNSAIQVAAARVLSMLCIVADKANPLSVGNVCFASDDVQVRDLSFAICDILSEETPRSEDLFVSVINLLIAAALHQPAFLVSIKSIKQNVELPLNSPGDMKCPPLEAASFRSMRPKKASITEWLLQYVKKSGHLIRSHPHLLLNVLKFLKALWQGSAQFIKMLEIIKSSEMFWKHLSPCVSDIASKNTSLENTNNGGTLYLAHRYLCQSAVLEIMAHDIFLQQRVLHAEMLEMHSNDSSDGKNENIASHQITKSSDLPDPESILSSWCEGSVMGSLIKSYATREFDKDAVLRAKMAASVCIVHIIGKLSVGDVGSLSLSFVEKIRSTFKKVLTISDMLREQPAYIELLSQQALRGYSGEKDLNAFILDDLYRHLEGALKGKQISPGPFKELSQYLLELEILWTNKHKCSIDIWPPAIDQYLFDPVRLQEDMGLQFWDHSGWVASKEVAESMLLHMHTANVMAFLADSQHAALKALTAILSVYERSLAEKKRTPHGGAISEKLLESCIDYLCEQLHETRESLVPVENASELTLNFLVAQTELLLNLSRCLYRRISQNTNKRQACPVSVLIIKTVGTSLRVLIDIKLLAMSHKTLVKLLLILLLESIEFCCPKSNLSEKSDLGSDDIFSEVSLMSLGLLPVLCNCIETPEYGNLSLAVIDIILKGFLASNTWLPVLQQHLRLQLLIQQLHQKDSLVSIPIILRFLLTLARTRGGAVMLQKANLFSSLKVLFSVSLDNIPCPNYHDEKTSLPTASNKDDRSQQHIWGLGLAIVTAIIYSLGEDDSSVDLVEGAIPYFLSEKASLMYYHLSAPDVPIDDHSKKRARVQRSQTSLTALRETEHTLMLICGLAKHQLSWIKAMRGTDSELRERSIHLLAFISRGAQRFGESPNKSPPLLCPPILKEELELNERSPFINCKRGWFALFAAGSAAKSKAAAISRIAQSLVVKDRVNESTNSATQTHFSDLVAIQMYRIAFLVLKFLCMQAKAAAKRAEDVGIVDVMHFPELPMPEILHGLQDQAIAIVTELCATGNSKSINPEIQSLCFLLLQIMEMALYLELCVSQTCGIRPVSVRIEDFSKEIKALIQVTEEHKFLKASLKSLKQIISFVYPGLLQTEGIL